MRSMFGGGSNLPPGCTSADVERAFGGRDPSPEEDEILSILEIAHVDGDVCEQVMDRVGKLCERLNRALRDTPDSASDAQAKTPGTP